LFATFLLGMFWKRATGHGAFLGLLSGILAATIHHGFTLPLHAVAGVKGGWFGATHIYPSEMAQNFWTAIFAWSTCFVVTILVSLVTRQQKSDAELIGLVSSLTPRAIEHETIWYKRPFMLGIFVLVLALILNITFW